VRSSSAIGFTLVELLVATTVLAIASLAIVNGFSATTLSSIESDRSQTIQTSLQVSYENLHDIAFDQLLAWNGTVIRRGDHDVTVSAHLIQVGLVQVEFTATNHRTGTVLARMATFRSGEY
jgi:prepilin-type N-terminal cleavage/methylation domain-containing protein